MDLLDTLPLDATQHAQRRMAQRGLRPRLVRLALLYGRRIQSRGARFVVVGRREVSEAAEHGIDLRKVENLILVLTAEDDADVLITAYRQSDFRHIRPARPTGRLARSSRAQRSKRRWQRGRAAELRTGFGERVRWVDDPKEFGESGVSMGTEELGELREAS